MNFADLVHKDFEIRDGKFYERHSGFSTGFYVREDIWIKGTYHVSGNYSANDYTIKTEQWTNNWYLYRGFSQICRLYYHGAENWTSY